MSVKWPPVIEEARVWVKAQAPFPVTLRQCFYHLVAIQMIPNEDYYYKRLSDRTAEARRKGEFPEFADQTRPIYLPRYWDSVSEFAPYAANEYGLDRTKGQKFRVVIAVEKRGMLDAVVRQFGGRGWLLVSLAGYSSVTLKHDVAPYLEDPRPSVLLYAGDLDASGEGILTDFAGDWDGLGAGKPPVRFDEVHKVALNVEQVLAHNLPLNTGKTDEEGKPTDTRAPRFNRKYRELIGSGGRFTENFQVEVDALPPAELNQLLVDAAAPFWDKSQFDEVVREEEELQRWILERLS